jgi:hypothetical protein
MTDKIGRITAATSVVLVFQSSFAFAEDSALQIQGEETFTAEVVGDNGSTNESIYGDDDNFSRYINTLDFRAANAVFDSALSLDTIFFHLPPSHVAVDNFVPGGAGYTTLDYDNNYRLEHLHGTIRLKTLRITAGDFHVNFGRGMVLSLIKVDDLAEDNRLRGLRIEYEVKRKLQAALVGGLVNALNVDPMTRQIYRDDPMDRVAGARVQWEALDALAAAAHAVILKPRYTDPREIETERLYFDRSPGVDVISGGGSLELHAEGIHAYVEGNGQSHTDHRALGREAVSEPGAAVVGEVSYDLSRFSIKAEGIYYHQWLMEGPYRGQGNLAAVTPTAYNNLVTLDVRFVPVKSMGNAAGGRLSLDYYVDALDLDLKLKCPFIKYLGGLLPEGGWSDHPPTWIVHPVLEAETRFGKKPVTLRLSGGGRMEHTSDPDIPGVDSGYLWHAETGVTVPIKGPHSLKVDAMVRHHALEVTEGHDYYVSSVSLGYDISNRFNAAAAYEYSDEITTEGNYIGDIPWLKTHHFAWIRSTLRLEEIRKGMSIQFFAGSERGGVKCVGGVCRQYPDTVGVRLDAVLSF